MRVYEFFGANINMAWRAWRRRLVLHKRPKLPWGYIVPKNELHQTLDKDKEFSTASRLIKNAGEAKDLPEIIKHALVIWHTREVISIAIFRRKIKDLLEVSKGIFFGSLTAGILSTAISSQYTMYSCIGFSLVIILAIFAVNVRAKFIFKYLERSRDQRLQDYLHKTCRNYGILNVDIKFVH